jgi:Co/Zn/Cd efflux system component
MNELQRKKSDAKFRKVLLQVLIVHIIMFAISLIAAFYSNSSSVFADSLDFIGDALNYGVSLLIVSSSLIIRSSLALTKALTMLFFGVPVFIFSMFRYDAGSIPSHEIMSITGSLGIAAHIYCISVLYKFRSGDSNRLSVWICTINDLTCNILTVVASYAVKITNDIWPDLLAAFIITLVTFCGALIILRQALIEIKLYRLEYGKNKTR